MRLGYDRPLYMLAFDHRGSFSKGLLGIEGAPTPEEAQRVADAKAVVYEAFELALDGGVDQGAAGLLVDEEFGADLARRARRAGVALAMPVERSGQAEFDFEFGVAFGEHVEDFDPAFAKVLVRYDADGDAELNARQNARLATLTEWLHARGRKLLFELLVPGEKAEADVQLAAMAQLRAAGVEPDIWKLEGLDRREECERVAAFARAGGRDGVACIVLGRGADEEGVLRWLRAGAGVSGYIGFAVGRTLWWDELEAYVAGAIDRAEAARRIAANYRRMVDAYESALPVPRAA